MNDEPLTAEQASAIAAESEEQAQAELDGDTSKLSKPSTPADDPETKDDGTTAPVIDEDDAAESAKTTTPPVVPAVAPAPVETPKPEDAPKRFDVQTYIDRAGEELKGKTYKDSDGKELTAEEAFDQYGHATGPERDRLEKIISFVIEDFKTELAEVRKALEPATRAAQAHAESMAAEAENKMLSALEKAGVSDARAMLTDPRIIEFVEKNPQYKSLVSTDSGNADRVSDLMFLIDRFRAKVGIAKPAASTATPVPSRKPVDNSTLAGLSSARGGGSPARETGDAGKTDEQIAIEEEEKILAEQKASRQQFSV